MVVLVHSSLSQMGWVCGGPVTVIQALMKAVSAEGTVVMPTHSYEYSNPENWKNPPVPKEWVSIIKETMPPFDPAYTPSSMGAIVECFRHFPGVLRSCHPTVSFAAWGRYKKKITENHALDHGLGEGSPLARIYGLDGHVLLLGVPYTSNTSFHLAEYRVGLRQGISQGAPVTVKGKRVWRVFKDIDYSDENFETIGMEFEKEGHVTRGYIGSAESRLFSQRKAVDFAAKWFSSLIDDISARERVGNGH